jgi:hypothetical protein
MDTEHVCRVWSGSENSGVLICLECGKIVDCRFNVCLCGTHGITLCPSHSNSAQHGYTCDLCDWGRDTYRNMTEYHDHVGETGHYGEMNHWADPRKKHGKCVHGEPCANMECPEWGRWTNPAPEEPVTYGLVVNEELLAAAIRANWYEIRPHGGNWVRPLDAAQAIIRECNILRRNR